MALFSIEANLTFLLPPEKDTFPDPLLRTCGGRRLNMRRA